MLATIRVATAILAIMTGMIGAVIAKISWWGTEPNQQCTPVP